MATVSPYLYVGLPLGACVLIQNGWAPACAFIWDGDVLGGRRLRRLAHSLGLENRYHFTDDIDGVLARAPRTSTAGDNPTGPLSMHALSCCHGGLLWYWPRRLPVELLAALGGPMLGLHPSLLPSFRGPDPFFWSIASGSTETGVSLYRVDEDYDTGPVILQSKIAIPETQTALGLSRSLDRLSLRLLPLVAAQLAEGRSWAGVAQSPSSGSWAPRPRATHLRVHWSASVAVLERLARAARPTYSLIANLGGQEVRLRSLRRHTGRVPIGLPVGTAFQEAGTVCVCCADGAVAVELATFGVG